LNSQDINIFLENVFSIKGVEDISGQSFSKSSGEETDGDFTKMAVENDSLLF